MMVCEQGRRGTLESDVQGGEGERLRREFLGGCMESRTKLKKSGFDCACLFPRLSTRDPGEVPGLQSWEETNREKHNKQNKIGRAHV